MVFKEKALAIQGGRRLERGILEVLNRTSPLSRPNLECDLVGHNVLLPVSEDPEGKHLDIFLVSMEAAGLLMSSDGSVAITNNGRERLKRLRRDVYVVNVFRQGSSGGKTILTTKDPTQAWRTATEHVKLERDLGLKVIIFCLEMGAVILNDNTVVAEIRWEPKTDLVSWLDPHEFEPLVNTEE